MDGYLEDDDIENSDLDNEGYADELPNDYDDSPNPEEAEASDGKIEKISNPEFVMMIIVAVIFDSLQFIISLTSLIGGVTALIGGIIATGIGLFGWLTFFVWFKIKGISFSSARRMTREVVTRLIELIPYLNMLPMLTFTVVVTKIEEKLESHSRLAHAPAKAYAKHQQA